MDGGSPRDDDDIPNFLMLDQIPANYTQQLETDLLEPVVFSQGGTTTDGFCRFTLQNKGFLHSHSKLFIALKPGANVNNAFLQPHVGIGQVVKKAVLKIGNKTLNEIDSWSALHAVKSSLISNENQLEREMYLTGRSLNHGFVYNDSSKVFADNMGLDNGVEYDTDDDLLQPTWARMNASATDECPSYSIDLSDLFPFLKVNQLPLYLIKEPINIEITFYPTVDHRVQISDTDTTDVACEIVRDQLKFCADYIFYGTSDEMDRFAMGRGKDLNFTFVDYRLVEHSTTTAQLGSGLVRNLGMANRMVPRVITLFNDSTDAHEETICGRNNSQAPFISANGVTGDVKYNLRYNDRFEFTSDVDNLARLFSIFQQSEGVPFIARQEFSLAGAISGGFTDREYNTRDQTELEAQFFNLSTRLTNGRVGQRGIELHVTYEADPTRECDLLRCYCEYIRVARLENGYFEVYNA
jgi:hypothetical protein